MEHLFHNRKFRERFAAKVKDTGSCWLWTGACSDNGYGQVRIGGRKGTTVSAHRIVWQLCRGPIPNDLKVCHTCDIPNCVNPNHLFLGTHQMNMDDMILKGRYRNPMW